MKTLQSTNRKSILALCLRACAPLCLFCPPVFAAINPSINYQGFLVSKATNLAVDTSQAMKFVLHTAAVGDMPTTPPFTETRCTVEVSKGRYDVEIGSMTVGGIPASIFKDYQNIWLEINVSPSGNCAGPYEAMQPRIKLAASPYAFSSVYASTAAAATPLFRANTIGALDVTDNGGLTISTNLYVMGGISVGEISPGQKLSVTGKVESKGLGVGGFVFPDGSEQITAIANTSWGMFGADVGSINPGNVGISTGAPQARLHIASDTYCDTCPMLLVTAGAGDPAFKVTGEGFATARNYFGDGSTLDGVVRTAGDTMGPLTLTAGSSITVTAANGISAPRLKLSNNVEISTTTTLNHSGVYISTNVFLPVGAKYYGDGSALQYVVSMDDTKVLKAGDTMTGQLNLPSLVVTSSFTVGVVGASTFSVLAGGVAVGNAGYLARFTVGGGIIATSSITAQGNLYAPVLSATSANISQGVTASSGVFTAVGAAQYSLVTSSSIFVGAGGYYIGDGSKLNFVTGTDASKVIKAGDTMTGNLTMSGSRITVILSSATEQYALTVSSVANPPNYWLAVTTGGNVGVQMSNPASPLSVYSRIQIGNHGTDTPASLHINSYNDRNYIRWSDGNSTDLGVLGFLYGPADRDFIYRAGASDLTSGGGTEVFRIRTSPDANNWRFGIGTINPAEKFHVATNLLVSTSPNNPILYVSTTTGQVGISTGATAYALQVNGGIYASSITAVSFHGNGAGLTEINAGALPASITVSTIIAASATGVVFSSEVFLNAKVNAGLGNIATLDPDANLQVMESVRIGAEGEGNTGAYLSLRPAGGPAYIKWSRGSGAYNNKGVLGFSGTAGLDNDLIYRANATLTDNGVEIFRVMGINSATDDMSNLGKFGIGTGRLSTPINPLEGFHVATNLLVSTAAASPILYVSTTTDRVGIGMADPQARLHVLSNSTIDPYVFVASHAVTGGLVVSTSGRVGVGITGPVARLDVKQSSGDTYALKVSSNDGTTAMMALDSAGQLGIGVNPPRAALSIGSGAILADGGYTDTLSVPVTGAGTRFMWLPSVAAIRAGAVGGTQWDTVGKYSTAFGDGTQATGDYSVAIGQNNKSYGDFSMVVGGRSNKVAGSESVVAGGYQNEVFGQYSFISGGSNNIVLSSFSWAGGYNNYLDVASSGTFVWGYDDNHDPGIDNTFKVTDDFVFLIDPADIKGYKVGVGTPSPQARLDVNGSAQFGAGPSKSTFTAEGFWQPRWMDNAEIQAAVPGVIGVVVGNSSIKDLCISTGAAAGNWALVGTKGLTGCY